MLTPKDIANKQFRAVRLKEGYDQDEVDTFLDDVEVALARALARADSLDRELARLRDAPTTVMQPVPASPVETADRLLRVAESTAQGHIDEAKAKADEIVREAGAKGARIVEDAVVAEERIKATARAEAEAITAAARGEEQAARERVEQLSQQITQLDEKRRNYKAWLQSMIDNMEDERG